ncbi:tRNA (adenosine(37)-N6)-dimethylallyltransferase MiaA [Paracoccus sp. DMF-8]|uniref:tRNA (adenosine(37)-N6)-dimethylallyltransferase MiaA n=1 Tax=Paracoccus sp. DMF-8 TaxID=3019445 RepID=UPI0023E78C1B|nr:tRNA (adenosine(37)-N6)-dimethylallyltransferase MiaA [Paracoccus sp. DMF-8]MDF3606451.1 tRNA (adenosine(37)-N6)-dimethylallyltransferase MiaA [Paracoccus sp. DMF-8]
MTSSRPDLPADIAADRHVVIAGPTASGKSALALRIAREQGGTVVNADALQIWDCWRVLTARPSVHDEARAPHALYGHVAPGRSYSVGDWLADVARLPGRLIVVGGTGLYLNALTRGLAVIPPVPADIRAQADAILAAGDLAGMIDQLDPRSRAAIDIRNPARVQRAWEVLRATGRGITDWQDDTPAPLIGPESGQFLLLQADRDWLADRIARRFDQMLDQGAAEEVRAMLPVWDPRQQWTKAIGAPELARWLGGKIDLATARELSVIATRQYAKSQRIWFRGRMRDWRKIDAAALN